MLQISQNQCQFILDNPTKRITLARPEKNYKNSTQNEILGFGKCRLSINRIYIDNSINFENSNFVMVRMYREKKCFENVTRYEVNSAGYFWQINNNSEIFLTFLKNKCANCC